MRGKIVGYIMAAILIVALFMCAAPSVWAMPPSPDDFCEDHDGTWDFYMEIIGWIHGVPVTTGHIYCYDGTYVDW